VLQAELLLSNLHRVHPQISKTKKYFDKAVQ
jgi:hypothetical protein